MTVVKEIVFELWRLAERRCYFVMSSAGAGIGYSLVVVDSSLDAFETRALLVAISFWAASFISGIWSLSAISRAMNFSRNAIEFRQRYEQTQPMQEAISEIILPDEKKVFLHMSFSYRFQLVTLLLGAFSFVFVKVDVLRAFGVSTP